ncbi:MAG: hypothetical protein LC647_00845 [Beggiatoa sp.]|nr:hypothetical protein [Beggiatoa sp.]
MREVAIEVLPVRPREAAARCCLVLFEEGCGPKSAAAGAERPSGWRARLYRWRAARAHPAPDVAASAGREALPEREGEAAQLR